MVYLKINCTFKNDEDIDKYMNEVKAKNKDPKYKSYFVKDKQLFYKLKDQEPIRILKTTEKEDVLEDLYKNDTNLLGKGIVQAYKYIRKMYGNLSRDEIKNFLAKQADYQIRSQQIKVIKRPITAKYPNQIWQVDLIDMEKYSGSNKKRNYIFVCVDVFSRKCWIQGMLLKEAQVAKECMEQIIAEADVKPDVIRCDQGGEFHGEFSQFCRDIGITIIFSQSHTPTQNSIVERTNRELRKIISSFFVKNRNMNWIDHLKEIEDAKNNAYISTIKNIPNDVWTNTKKEIDENIDLNDNTNTILVTRAEILKRANNAKEKYLEQDNFKEGDKVRVRMDALFANQRAEIKKGNSKQLIIRYSPEIFEVYQVINSRVGHKKYILINSDDYQLGVNGKIKYFKADEMIPASEPSSLTSKRALQINKIQPTKNDVIVD